MKKHEKTQERAGAISSKNAVRKAGLQRCLKKLAADAERLRLPIVLTGLDDLDREVNAAMEHERGVDAELLTVQGRIQQQIMRAQYRERLGLYGVCEGCQKEIPITRMDALPYAVNCKVCENGNGASIVIEGGKDTVDAHPHADSKHTSFFTLSEVENLL